MVMRRREREREKGRKEWKVKAGLSMNMRGHVPTILSNRRIGLSPGRDGNTLDAFPGFIYSPSFLEFVEKYYTSNS